jgi:hypothetical protein
MPGFLHAGISGVFHIVPAAYLLVLSAPAYFHSRRDSPYTFFEKAGGSMPRISGRLAIALVACAISTVAWGQGRGATAAQARAYIYGAFLTQAAPGILSDSVRLGPELE